MSSKKNKALFLDRDGVINFDYGHVHKIEDFHFIEGIFDLCEFYQSQGFIIIIVTNQAGISKGFYDISQYEILTNWMIKEFKNNGININKVYYCPDHPNSKSKCRKPEPGMLISAIKEFNIDPSKSFLYGDKDSDIEAGRRAGVKNLIKVKNNKLKI